MGVTLERQSISETQANFPFTYSLQHQVSIQCFCSSSNSSLLMSSAEVSSVVVRQAASQGTALELRCRYNGFRLQSIAVLLFYLWAAVTASTTLSLLNKNLQYVCGSFARWNLDGSTALCASKKLREKQPLCYLYQLSGQEKNV